METTYTWNASDRLTGVTLDRTPLGSPDVSAAYTFDASGQRTRSVVTSGGVVTDTNYVFDGTTLRSLSSRVGTLTTDVTYLFDELGHPRALAAGSSDTTGVRTFALATTTRGDVVAMTDAAGNVVATWAFDAYGVPTGSSVATTPLVADLAYARRIAGLQVLRYAGYVFDAESGLYYCSQRFYDPASCQWLSRDPIGADGQESAYLYCGGDPVGATDKTGLITDDEAEAWSVSYRLARGNRTVAAARARWIRKAHSVARAKHKTEKARAAADAAVAAARSEYEVARADAVSDPVDVRWVVDMRTSAPGGGYQQRQGVSLVAPPDVKHAAGPWYLRTRPDATGWFVEGVGLVCDIAGLPTFSVAWWVSAAIDGAETGRQIIRTRAGDSTPMDVVAAGASIAPGVSAGIFLTDVIVGAIESGTHKPQPMYAQ